MNVKNLFKNVLAKSSEAEQNAKDYADSLEASGTFSITIPRLNNQTITFNYVRLHNNVTIANAKFLANSVSGTSTIYLPFEDQTVLGFVPDAIWGVALVSSSNIVACNRANGNANLWIPVTQSVISGQQINVSLVIIGG